MPWYRTGTVAITAGQTTVTGTGTSFSANSRVGDAFQGPDGRWYEVTNIASGTVLSILPAYQGATVSGGAYGLAPMQGYVKESADRLRQLVDQWGTTLASLGAVSIENVVPVTKGGTGGTTQAAARAGLGLVLTTSATDNTPGRVMKTGDFGIGGTATLVTGAQLDALNHTITGCYGITGGEAASIGIAPAYGGSVFHQGRPGETATQLYMSTGTADMQMQMRSWSSAGGWTPWRRMYHSGNVVGAVAQSSAGAVIERGSNANGEYVRYADGTQICWTTTSGLVPPAGNSSVTWTFPIAFASRPGFVTMTPDIGVGSDARNYVGQSQYSATSASSCKFVTYMATAVGCGAFAIGRWF